MKKTLGIFGAALLIGGIAHCGGGDDSNGATSPGNDGGPGGGGDGSPGNEAGSEGGGSGITVNGTVIDSDSGNAKLGLANRDVYLIDANAKVTKVTTGSDGKFSASGIVTPYDISIPAVTPDAALVPAFPSFYAGVTRPDPVVQNDSLVPVDKGSEITTDLTFTATALANCTIYVAAAGAVSLPRVAGTGGSKVYDTTAAGSLYQWYTDGSTNRTTTFYLMTVTNAGGVVTGFTSVGPKSYTSSTASVDLGTIDFTTVTSGTTEIQESAAPPGLTLGTGVAHTNYSDGTPLIDLMVDASHVLTYPSNVGGISFILSGGASGSAGTSSYYLVQKTLPIPTPLAVTYETPITLTTPADNATAVADTDSFAWQPSAKPRVYTQLIQEPYGYIRVYTTTPKVEIARLKLGQISLPSGAAQMWTVATDTQGGAGQTMDDFVSPTPPSLDNVLSYETSSPYFTFTTQ